MRRWFVAAIVAGCSGSSSPPDAKPAAVYALDPSFGVDGIAVLPLNVADRTPVTQLPTRAGLVIMTFTRAEELAFCRLTNQGELDLSYGGSNTGCHLVPGLFFSSSVTDGTDIFVAAHSKSSLPVAGPAIFRFRSDGTLDTTWGTQGALALSPPPPTPPNNSVPFVTRLLILADNTLVAQGVYGQNNVAGEGWFQRVRGSTVDPSVLLPPSGDPFARVVVSTTGTEISLLATYEAPSPLACPPYPCPATTDVCRFGVCMPDPPSCMSGCPTTFRCDMELGECIHKTVSSTGTEITRLSSSLTTVDVTRVSGVGAAHATLLPGGRRLVQASWGGPYWLLTPDGKRDFSVGLDGIIFANGPTAIAGRADGGIVVVVPNLDGEKTPVKELTAAGKLLTQFEPPTDVGLTALNIPDDATLLAGGERAETIVILRYLRTVP